MSGGYKVFVTRMLPEPAIEKLRNAPEVAEVRINPHDRVITREELIEGVRWCDALLCLLTDTVDAEVMDANPNLKVIANYAVGFNNIDVAEATKRKIPVTNTPGVLTETTADLAWALMMAVARRLNEAERFLRSGKWNGWGPMQFLGADVWGKVLGIVGFGRIGKAVARRAWGFDMRVIYYDYVRSDEEIERALRATYVPFDELLQVADFVSIHVPLIMHGPNKTYHMFGDREFDLMKPTAFLINTSRGPVVDEKALVRALKDGKIAGAGLDVYENEPSVEPELLEMENVVLLPHIGSATNETRTRMALIAVENLLAALRGERPPNVVNPEIYSAEAD
ncbi:MAG: D-glycerate dehydrogenase [Armatimonadota bacterium]|nr:D-glycerate dehydrogenase [Armatimonadota bacterium]MCX7776815.1 D-glycerate dehydrogenase [Armatimonadota bacterium]MDW8024610.1 D-glycerate dehydrogenase [Armatimonadota bacterium]